MRQIVEFALAILLVIAARTPATTQAAEAPSDLNFAEGLQKSLYFFEAQLSGRLPTGHRVEWRSDSCLFDGRDVNLDLTGGLFNSGDHGKLNRTMSFTAGLLAWSAIEYREGYEKSGQLTQVLNTLRWINEYFLKCIVRDDLNNFEIYIEVGDPGQDQSFWAPAEVKHLLTPVRPAYKITPKCPGSDVLGGMAGAMAASSMVFREKGERAYADLLLEKADRLFAIANNHRNAGIKMDSRGRILGQSHNEYFDELLWACAWLHLAKNSQDSRFGRSYLNEAFLIYNSDSFDGRQLRHWEDFNSWNLGKGAYLLLARLTDDARFYREIERHLDWWTVGITDKAGLTRGGLAFHSENRGPLIPGALGQACNEAFLAFVYGDWIRNAKLKQRYLNFARSQVRYAVGANPARRSYVVGFGQNPPTIIRHSTAHGPFAGFDHFNPRNPAYRLEARHVMYGALLGGPDKNDQFYENNIETVQREAAIDSNAGFTGCLARMFLETGGTSQPLTNFPPAEIRQEEFFVEGGIISYSESHLEISARVHNHTAWPARVTDRLSIKYFFTLEPNIVPGMISVGTTYSEGAKVPAKIQSFRGRIFFAEADFTGMPVFPGGLDPNRGGRPAYRKEVRFRLNHPKIWNNQGDWSYAGLAVKGKPPVRTTHICLYDGGKLIFGEEPPQEKQSP
ncbi:MAG: glycoside hydrolase family 9 protein [Opitutaceae bacterium]|nr:glycoside hydrolase family 9 protein [Verrucomicrobiales bacterium]